MSQSQPGKTDRTTYWKNLTLAGIAAQSGCLTLVIVLLAVFGGLWLDATFKTRPLFTIGLLLVSIPLSIVVMILFARAAASRIKTGRSDQPSAETKEADIGKDA